MITLKELMDLLQERGISVWTEGGTLKYKAVKGRLTEDLKLLLKERKDEIVALLEGKSAFPPLTPAQPGEPIPPSYTQQRIWYTCQFDEYSSRYNMVMPFEMSGAIDVAKMSDALGELESKHDALRSNVVENEGQLRLVVAPSPRISMIVEADQEADAAYFKERITLERAYSFDLAHEPLVRVGLIKKDAQTWYLWMNVHHIISDGWSSNIILAEWLSFYNGAAGQTNLAVQYADYCLWERKLMQSELYEKTKRFWSDYLNQSPEITTLTPQFSRSAEQSFKAGVVTATIEREVTARLLKKTAAQGLTPYMTFLGIFSQLLFRYAKQNDVVIGTPVANRPLAELNNIIGCFFNILPLRFRQDAEASIAEYLEAVREQLLKVYENQIMPFDKIVEERNPHRSMSHHPVYQVMFNMNTTGRGSSVEGLSLTPFPHTPVITGYFDLAVEVTEQEGSYSSVITYNSHLYSKEFIEDFSLRFNRLLSFCSDHLDALVPRLEVFTSDERERMLDQWKGEVSALDVTQSIGSLITQAATTHTHKVALVDQQRQVTYEQLEQLSTGFAGRLVTELQLQPEEIVGVYMDRSSEMVISLLAILKAGGCYLPIDTDLPAERINYMLENAGCRYVITDRLSSSSLSMSVERISYSDDLTSFSDTPLPMVKSNQLAYVIYTSGTTGKPKGTLIEHGSVVNLFAALDEKFGTEPGKMLTATTISFDISVLELFWSLSNGFEVVLHDTVKENWLSSGEENLAVDFSLFYFSSLDNAIKTNKYALVLEGARFADENGLKAVWTPERHFHPFGGLYPNPSVISAAIAAVTKRVEIRAGSVVAPLHNPLRIAEEWAVVDNLSSGRVAISFASGWQSNDFVLAPKAFRDKNAYYAQIETVRKLWQGEAIILPNGEGRAVETQVYPKPIQQILPFWITASSNRDTFVRAGSMGANVLTHLLTQTISDLEENILAYRKARCDHGFDPNKGIVTVMLHTYIGDDANQVRSIVHEPFTNYLRSSANIMSNLIDESGIDIDDLIHKQVQDEILANARERFLQHSSLIGTVEACMQMVKRITEAGANEIACLIDFGVENSKVMDSLAKLKELKSRWQSSKSIYRKITDHTITHFQCTPSLAELLLTDPRTEEALSSLQIFMVGGEKLSSTLATRITSKLRGNLFNMYGPTEATIWSSCEHIRGDGPVYIGQPFRNVAYYVLDEYLQPVPFGVVGELYVGGKGLARGYLNAPQLTSQKFLRNPFSTDSDARMYKTGDLVKYDALGNIEYLERNDNQVKINGHRVEIGEVEHVIGTLPEVRNVVVLNDEDLGKVRLVAYVIAEQGVESSASWLRSQLYEVLPNYMVPSRIVFLDAFPRNSSGKVDTKALVQIETVSPAQQLDDPETENEVILLSIWQELFDSQAIGVTDNYFELGGDSIQSIQMIAKAREAGLQLGLDLIFKYQTVRDLARQAKKVDTSAKGSQTPNGIIPLTPVQQWFFEQHLDYPDHYNQALMVEFGQPVNELALMDALGLLHEQHDMLRASFTISDKEIVQEVSPSPVNVDFEVTRFKKSIDKHVITQKVIGRAQESLNLRLGKLSAFRLIIDEEDQCVSLLMVIHHLVIDGISWRVLLDDLYSFYKSGEEKNAIEPPHKTASFKFWSQHLYSQAQKPEINSFINTWGSLVKENIAPIPRDFSELTENKVKSEKQILVSLDASVTNQLLTGIARRGIEINDMLVAALLSAFRSWTGRDELYFDMEGHGRKTTDIDISSTVGWFTSIYPVLVKGKGMVGFELLKQVKSTLRNISADGTSFGLLKYLTSDESIRGQMRSIPTPEIIFNYIGQVDNAFSHWDKTEVIIGSVHHPENYRSYIVDIAAFVKEHRLQLVWTYSDVIHKEDTIRGVADTFVESLVDLIEDSRIQSDSLFVSANFPMIDLSQDTVDSLVASIDRVVDIYPLSPMQESMLYHLIDEEETDAYFQQFSVYIKGAVDADQLARAIRKATLENEVLRTSFHYERLSYPVQVVQEEVDPVLIFKNYSAMSGDDLRQAIEAYLATDRSQKFSLTEAPNFRISLIACGEDEYHLTISFSHLILDGWSLPIFYETIFKNYHRSAIQPSNPTIGSNPFRAYISFLNQQDQEASQRFWTKSLDGFTVPTTIGSGLLSTTNSPISGTYETALSYEQTQALRTVAKSHRFTLNTFFQGIWSYLLAHCTGEDDVIFGTTLAGRPAHMEGSLQALGCFVNTIAVRVQLDQTQQVSEWLRKIQQEQNQREEFGYYSLPEIQACSQIYGHPPLFDSLLVFENYPVKAAVDATTGWEISGVSSFERTNFPLTILVVPDEQVHIRLHYYKSELSDEYVKMLGDKMVYLASQFLHNMDQAIAEVNLVSDEEQAALLKMGQGVSLEVPSELSVLGMIDRFATETPTATAVICGEEVFSYEQLVDLSNKLSHYLSSRQSIEEGDFVGVMLERSEWLPVAILAVMRTGATYVPIESAYPETRIDFMIKDANCRVVVTDEVISDFRQRVDEFEAASELKQVKSESVAYLMYTSGSTSVPKGVMVSQRNLLELVCWGHHEFEKLAFDVMYFSTSVCFDFSIIEIFLALTVGKTLRVVVNAAAMQQTLEEDRKILICGVPSTVNMLVQENSDLSQVVAINVGGEAVPQGLIDSLEVERIEVRNLYGPTEDTVLTTCYRIVDPSKVTIGRPIANETVYVLDDERKLVLPGVVGELCVSGAGLSKGYLNRESITKKSFVPNPFKPGALLYRTGDYGRWLPDGNLDFLGRRDNQVKLRGYRIELDEVETCLLRNPAISDACALIRSNGSEEELVAFVVADTIDTNEVRNFTLSRLPHFMVPSKIIQLDHLPLNSSGKVDRKALLAIPKEEVLSQDTSTLPQSEQQQVILDLWKEHLQTEEIGTDSNFFELGGYSLKALRIVNAYSSKLDTKLTLQEFFAHPTIREQALLLTKKPSTKLLSIPVTDLTHYPLSYSQRRLWMVSQFEEGARAYNVTVALQIHDPLKVDALSAALQAVVNRHDSLRTVFREGSSGEAIQLILPPNEVTVDLKHVFISDKNFEEELNEHIASMDGHVFDLEQGPLMRTLLLERDAKTFVFVLTIHHIIGDGWSLEVFCRDLLNAYENTLNGVDPLLPPLELQHKDFVVWQQQELLNEQDVHKAYWMGKLARPLPTLEIPGEKVRPIVQTYAGSSVKRSLEKSTVDVLQGLAAKHDATLFMGVLACLKAFLSRYTGQHDVIVGVAVAGRNHIDLKDQIGFFINTVALRTSFEPQQTIQQMIGKVKATVLEGFDHQMYPFERIVDELALERDLGRNPIFDIMVTYEGESFSGEKPTLQLANFDTKVIERPQTTSRFDITFNFVENGGHILLDIEYNSDVYDASSIERLADHLINFVNRWMESPGLVIADVKYLSEPEEQQLVHDFNNTQQDIAEQETLPSLFAKQVRLNPDSPAITYDEKSLTYEGLDKLSNRLANYILENTFLDVDDLIGIKLERSEWFVVSMLAVMKTGAAFVPIDVSYSSMRQDYILDSSNCNLVVDEDFVNQFKEEQQGCDDALPDTEVLSSHLAYVIYTSGSTGQPKGVMIAHQNIVNTIVSQIDLFEIEASDHCLQFASPSFDACVSEVFVTLLQGAHLFVIDDTEKRDIKLFSQYVKQRGITWATLPPAYVKVLDDDTVAMLRKLVTAGEQAFVNKALLSKKDGYYINAYGPTETSICATVYKGRPRKSIPIGKPIANTKIFILDDLLNLMPIGATGEIYIAGRSVGRGYLNQPDLTSSAFITSPFAPEHLIYKTGDLGRWLPDGNIEFLGRRDSQVKIRGFRVELAEVETAVERLDEISHCVVDVRELNSDPVLVAFTVSKVQYDKKDTRERLKKLLPAYMLPSFFVEIDEIPINANGKVDRSALPLLKEEDKVVSAYVAPSGALEEKMVALWQEVLGTDQISVVDDFYDIGGNSLKLIELHERINETFDVNIPITVVFKKPSVQELCAELQSNDYSVDAANTMQQNNDSL